MIGSGGPGTLGPERLRERIWLNGVYSFEDAIAELTSEGIDDPDRIGIAGYSRGSQMVNVAMTHSDILRHAASGDGNSLETASYSAPKDRYHAVFVVHPSGNSLNSYRPLAPHPLPQN